MSISTIIFRWHLSVISARRSHTRRPFPTIINWDDEKIGFLGCSHHHPKHHKKNSTINRPLKKNEAKQRTPSHTWRQCTIRTANENNNKHMQNNANPASDSHEKYDQPRARAAAVNPRGRRRHFSATARSALSALARAACQR